MDNSIELHRLLNELATMQPEDTAARIDAIAFAFRDCRLELIRSGASLSQAQRHRMLQMQHRLDMVVEGKGSVDAVPTEARRALAAFGWGID